MPSAPDLFEQSTETCHTQEKDSRGYCRPTNRYPPAHVISWHLGGPCWPRSGRWKLPEIRGADPKEQDPSVEDPQNMSPLGHLWKLPEQIRKIRRKGQTQPACRCHANALKTQHVWGIYKYKSCFWASRYQATSKRNSRLPCKL